MTLQEIGIVVAACVGVWTAASTVLNVAVVANERRDAFLLGRVKDQYLTYEHKELILYNDWLPMVTASALVSLALCLAVIVGPWFLIGDERYAGPVSVLGCVLFAFVAITQLLGTLKEFRVMKRALDSAKHAIPNPALNDAQPRAPLGG